MANQGNSVNYVSPRKPSSKKSLVRSARLERAHPACNSAPLSIVVRLYKCTQGATLVVLGKILSYLMRSVTKLHQKMRDPRGSISQHSSTSDRNIMCLRFETQKQRETCGAFWQRPGYSRPTVECEVFRTRHGREARHAQRACPTLLGFASRLSPKYSPHTKRPLTPYAIQYMMCGSAK